MCVSGNLCAVLELFGLYIFQSVLEEWQSNAAKVNEEDSAPVQKGVRKPREKKDVTKDILKGLKLVLKQLTIHKSEREKQLLTDYKQGIFRYQQVAKQIVEACEVEKESTESDGREGGGAAETSTMPLSTALLQAKGKVEGAFQDNVALVPTPVGIPVDLSSAKWAAQSNTPRAHQATLYSAAGDGAWESSYQEDSDMKEEWLQVDLGYECAVSAVLVQGKHHPAV